MFINMQRQVLKHMYIIFLGEHLYELYILLQLYFNCDLQKHNNDNL